MRLGLTTRFHPKGARSRRAPLLLAGAAVTTGALLAGAAPAQAYSPNPTPTSHTRDTDNCPCSLSDPFDGTYFQHDAGGKALKVELRDGSWFIGKVEFHPQGEKLWVYDTKNDNDTIYVRLSYRYKGVTSGLYGPYKAPGTSKTVDHTVKDFDIPEGADVLVYFYDSRDRSDYIGSGHAVA
ncbi:hypothetical protein DY218_21140 [Streptomyces triticagri]|uniref:Secreted protein n=1 Tax=Streptomyces triticagri TaxID=2293568 RepID=A0A372M1D2_9ACTN|nr:hypothetical protein [Streptomyces triticagri]RFU84701.1 hypothetical protein DY218_21140 [Streptomyces triticagri]